ncbi:HNH endonuclease [Acinetobacter sp. FDAARGOS_515]|uniref:HNH endonuclease n=1 Tax=Acinetobacter sp. FDAARGOS_515 TaxID=2420307 RepID=UPI000F67AA10|nr:HNH endonuclease [Acinetobacter sp. FDAARGOS_515]RSC23542.1 HNH endonuclease [Acinetobacter sp. FDAARGOS_515]
MTVDNSACFSSFSKPTLNCALCNTPFTPKRADSTACSSKCRDKIKYLKNREIKTSACLNCNSLYTKKQGQSKYCSNECRVEHIASNGIDARAIETKYMKMVVRVSFCVVCSSACEAPYQGRLKKYCSSKCESALERTTPRYRAKRARRDARKRKAITAAPIDPIMILERDKWKCYLCGIDTPKTLRGTIKDNAPEVDHIIPLSKGGGHVESNLRCACRKCNAEKSDQIYQLI